MLLAVLCASSVFCIGIVGCGGESSFPQRPISLICPWSAGGGTDRVARQLAVGMESELGVPVNVINATGGGGVTGHTRGAQARADGYTLTVITVELSMLHWRDLTSLTYRDFAPLKLLNRDAAALFVRDDGRFRTLDDLESAIADSPTAIKASGTAFGGVWHLALAGWLDSRGLPADAATWISINGAGPSIQELLAGGIDVLCCSLPEAEAVVAGGQVRCLGVMSEERIAGFESVPTFREQQHAWSLAGWRGLAAPRDTPVDRLEVLTEAIDRVTATAAFRDFMASSGFDLSLEGPEEFRETLGRQDELFGAILTRDAFRAVSGEHFGPLMFPAVLGLALLVVFAVVIREIRRESAVDATSEPVAGTGTGTEFNAPWRAAAVAASVAGYGLLSESLGFLITACLMLIVLMLALGVTRRVALATAVVASLMTYQLFGVLLRVPLPRGFWEW